MEDLDAASVDDVKQFFKTYYAPNNAVLALVGDLDTKETLAKVKKYFGDIPRQTPPTPADLTEPAKTGERRAKLDDPLARAHAHRLAYRIPPSDTRRLARARGAAHPRRRWRLRRTRRRWRRQQLAPLSQAGAGEGTRHQRLLQYRHGRVGPGTFHISATLRPGKTARGSRGPDLRRDRPPALRSPSPPRNWTRRASICAAAPRPRLTVLSRAQALADAAAVFDDPDRVNTDMRAAAGGDRRRHQKAAKAYLPPPTASSGHANRPPAAPEPRAKQKRRTLAMNNALVAFVALAVCRPPRSRRRSADASTFRGMVRLNRAPVSNEVLKVKLRVRWSASSPTACAW